MFVPMVKLNRKKDRAGTALEPVRLVRLPLNVAGPNVAFSGRNKVTFFRSISLEAVIFVSLKDLDIMATETENMNVGDGRLA